MNNCHTKQQLIWIFWTTVLMTVGLILFKYLPIYLYGKNILYDASISCCFYNLDCIILWFFIDQKKSWRIPYLILQEQC